MKLQYWGTAATEGVPAIFCLCENCKKARALGGKNLRSRSQASIDDTLLIDLNEDTYWHEIRYNKDLVNFHHLLITHTHPDHLQPEIFYNRVHGLCHTDGKESMLTVYGSPRVTGIVDQVIRNDLKGFEGRLSTRTLAPFEPTDIEEYTVTALPAQHAEWTGPYIYQISKGGKTLLYGHDSDVFGEEVFAYWRQNGVRFDYVSLDCTAGTTHITYHGHMSFERNLLVREKMIACGAADEKTVFCCNHFSHNHPACLYDVMKPVADEHGFLVSYDGMSVEI